MFKRLSVVMLFLMPVRAFGATFVVDNIGDESDAVLGDGKCRAVTGGCTLRAATEEAQMLVESSDIGFTIPGSGVHRIRVTWALNLNNVTVDGITQPDSSGGDLKIVLEGPGVDVEYCGLQLGSNNTVMNLWITGFNNPEDNAPGGICVNGDNNNVVANRLERNANGVKVYGNNSNVEGNLWLGNRQQGASIMPGSRATRVVGNSDRVTLMSVPDPNGTCVRTFGTDDLLVMGNRCANGIEVGDSEPASVLASTNVTIVGNFLDDGTIRIKHASNVLIGGDDPEDANVVSSASVAIEAIEESSEVIIVGNHISRSGNGINVTSDYAIVRGNILDRCRVGIVMFGNFGLAEQNDITRSTFGLIVLGSQNTVVGNLLSRDKVALAVLGVFGLFPGKRGDYNLVQGNEISRNKWGLLLAGETVVDNLFEGNTLIRNSRAPVALRDEKLRKLIVKEFGADFPLLGPAGVGNVLRDNLLSRNGRADRKFVAAFQF